MLVSSKQNVENIADYKAVSATRDRCAQMIRAAVSVLFLINFMIPTQTLASTSDDNGFVPYGVLAVDVFSNTSGGLTTGTSMYALLDLGVEADLQKLFGWNGVSLHVGTLWGNGDDPSADVGDFNALSNIIMPEGGRLFEVFLEKTYEGEQVRIKAGLIGLDGDFQGSEYSAGFINSGFGVVPTLSANMPTPIFPQAALGMVLQLAITESSYMQIGIFDGDSGADEHGTDISLGSRQGTAIAFEYGADALSGNYKVGAVYHTGEFTNVNNGSKVDGNSSFYAVIDQALVADGNGEPKLAGFIRLGLSPQEERNTVSSYAEFGINLFEPLSGRENDLFGVGFLYTDFSEDFIKAERLAGNTANDTESVLEIFYQAEITPWLVFKPDVQFIQNPISSKDSTVVGLRLEGSF